jgi:hypothetical protein
VDNRPDIGRSLDILLACPTQGRHHGNHGGTDRSIHASWALASLTMVVEVDSPSTARIDRTAKRDRYAQGGIAQYWIVDPGIGRTGVASVTVDDLEPDGYREVAHAKGDDEIVVTLPVGGAQPVTVIPADLIKF